MERQAEANRFVIFLLCALVPLGSLAPTATSGESETTRGQRQDPYITSVKPLAEVIKRQATTLFKNYNACSPITPQTVSWLTAGSQAKAMVKKIPECPAFDAGCCAFHVFYNVLQSLRSDIESICGKTLTRFVAANINQLNTTLSERAALYTCENKDLLQGDHGGVPSMPTAEKKMYIWQVLEKYEQFTRSTTQRYSAAERGYPRVTK